MQDPLLVSIIVVTYRKFEAVENTLKSVFSQDYPNIELIVADDGSDNFPREQLETYIEKNKGENIRNYTVYSNEQNLGTVRNLNTAHRKCTGEIVLELAGDDEFYSRTVVSQIVHRMQETKCGFLSASRLVISEAGESRYYLPHKIHRKKLMRYDRETQYEKMVSGQFYAMFSGSAVAFREDSFRKMGGYDEKYRLWEDGPYFERYLRENRVEPAYDIIMTKYRLGGVSTGTIHPLLKKDGEIYDATDRICRLDRIKPFYAALTAFNIGRKDLCPQSKKYAIPIRLYKLKYKASYELGRITDQISLKAGK